MKNNIKFSIVFMLLVGILFFYCISLVSATVTTTLNYPADLDISYNYTVIINSSSLTDSGQIKNMSLWTNISGTWNLNSTIIFSIGSGKRYENFSTGADTYYLATTTRKGGQSFTVGATSDNENFYASKIHLHILKNGAVSTFNISIYNSAAGVPSTQVISQQFDGSLLTASAYNWTNFTFTNPPLLSASTQYVLIIEQPNANQIEWTYASGGGYIGGSGVDCNPACSAIAGDAYFEIYSDLGSTSRNAQFLFNITKPTLWNILACATDDSCSFGASNRTILLDISPPTINLLYPTGTINYGYVGKNVSLNYTFSDSNIQSCWYNYNLTTNITIPCASNSSLILTTLKNITLYTNDTLGNFNSSSFGWGYSLFENNRTYSSTTVSGATETFTLNFSSTGFSSIDFIYNNTIYSPSVTNVGSNYIASNSITIPTITSQTNKTFYWKFNGGTINTTLSNQTINTFQMDNCAVYSTLLLNYTLYDEDTQELIPDISNTTTEISVNLYNYNYNTLLSTFSLNSTTNNTRVCIGDLGSSNYYIDVIARYDGGSNYVSEFNNIQKQFINSSSPVINIPLYNLLTTRSQEFLVTFKDSNFQLDPDILIDVTRQYIGEGVFKTVEVSKTDNQGQALVHLVLSDVIYTVIFKKNGEILSVLDNVQAKCNNIATGDCTINANAYVSTLETQDFNYNNGLAVIQRFDEDTRTVYAQFSTQSGAANLVTLNVTKFDRFGNNTVCSDSLTSSSGELSCIIPLSFGNSTVISSVYNEGILSSQVMFSIGGNANDNYGIGNSILLAIIIITTLSMLFISDIRGILLGSFIGLLLSGLLVFINSGSLFSVGSAITYALIAGGIILWKVNQKVER